MRAKSDILEDLKSKLNDDIWKKLQNSLLGRELLALGAEIISENENVKDTMLLQMNPDTADKYGLYMLSQMNEIPITNVKPSTVTVEMRSPVKTYAPYELSYSIGNVHFTNIEYTMQGKSVSLINGTYKCYAHGVEPSEGAVEDGSETYFYDGTNSYSGIKLGNAYPDSIVVYDENGLEIPRYSSDIALSENVNMMYKVITGVDGNIYIRFLSSDSIYSNPVNFKIDWLDHSAMEFDVEDYEVKDGDNVVADIRYYSQGNTDDLDYMRNQLKKEMAKYNGLNTPSSVESYVKGLPYVLDAKCDKSEEGICVYIKPSSETMDYQTYLDFSEIAAHISLNSILFPNIKVKTATQIRFGVEIGGVNDLKLQQGIKSLLQESFSYENMTFNTVINTGNILSEIYGKYGIVPTINMTIKENFAQNKPLSFTPIKNSLKLYDINDSVVAWEEDDLLYGKIESKSDIPFLLFDMVGSMGTMFLLMYKGNITSSDRQTIDGVSGSDVQKTLYESNITYAKAGYNKFYLYDVSTNTIKAFDGCMQNLLYSDTNPSLKYNAWNTDEQSLGNLYDFKVLSTNNAFVAQMVFKNSGAEAEKITEGQTISYKFKDWLNKEDNQDLYEHYYNGDFVEFESQEDCKGKYQTTFFIKNPLALKNYNSDSWNTFQNASHGDPDEISGLYTGLRSITNDRIQLNVKSNWFVHNNKSYHAYEITNDHIYITNGAKNLAITTNGTFLGMMPYENDLYVINPKYVTKVVGFEGLKEKEEIYKIHKDTNTPLTITNIMREFDNRIAFKTVEGVYYTATGFEVIGDNMMGFKDLKEIIPSNDVTLDPDCKLGGCTSDYVTFYKKIYKKEAKDTTTDIITTGFDFYSYEIGNGKLSVYNKIMTAEIPHDPAGSATIGDYKVNLATYWDDTDSAQKSSGVTGDYGGRLCYLLYEGASQRIQYVTNKKDIFFLQNGNRYELYIDNIRIGNETCAIPLWIKHPNSSTEQIYAGSNDNTWYNTGAGTSTYDTDFIASFYKVSFKNFYRNSSTYKSGFDADNPKSIETQIDGEIIKQIYTNTTLVNRDVKYDINGSTDKQTVSNWFTTGVNISNQSVPGAGVGLDLATDAHIDSTAVGAVEDYEIKGQAKKIDGGYVNLDVTTGKKLNIVFFTQTTISQRSDGFNTTDATGEEEISTIGYYDTDNNSIVNDRGTETSYIRYNTLNPNITSGSYLVLDEDEIKFV